MRPEDRDPAYLWDMREAARSIVEMTKEVGLEQFGTDLMRRLAVERLFTVLGETARRTSPTFKSAHPEIPWSSIVGLRNLVTHEYEKVVTDTIWQISRGSVPELLKMLEPLVPPPPEEPQE